MSGISVSVRLCFFFFQAEDGIRDIGVTGVQTCALPILLTFESERMNQSASNVSTSSSFSATCVAGTGRRSPPRAASTDLRSEERRVGKEGRSRWWPYHSKQYSMTTNHSTT